MVCSEKGSGRMQQKRNPCKVTQQKRRLLMTVDLSDLSVWPSREWWQLPLTITPGNLGKLICFTTFGWRGPDGGGQDSDSPREDGGRGM